MSDPEKHQVLRQLRLQAGHSTPNAFLFEQQIPTNTDLWLPFAVIERSLARAKATGLTGGIHLQGADELAVLYTMIAMRDRNMQQPLSVVPSANWDKQAFAQGAALCQIPHTPHPFLPPPPGIHWAVLLSSTAIPSAELDKLLPGAICVAPEPIDGLETVDEALGLQRKPLPSDSTASDPQIQDTLELSDLAMETANRDRLLHFGAIFDERIDFVHEWIRQFREPSRIDFINTCLETRQLRDYLEIGVNNPATCFDLIKTHSKWSVDPGFEYAPNPVDFPMTSDAFFEALEAGRLECMRLPLPKDSCFDLIFIDGLHRAEQAWRDICNALEHLRPGGIIVVHDCLPPNEHCAIDPFPKSMNAVTSQYWQGSTWRAFERYCREGAFDAFVIDADSGMGIIDSRQPAGPRPAENPFLVLSNYRGDLIGASRLETFSEAVKRIATAPAS